MIGRGTHSRNHTTNIFKKLEADDPGPAHALMDADYDFKHAR